MADVTPSQPLVDYSNRLGFLMAQAHRALQCAMDAELAPLGLTIAQFGTLTILAAHPGLSSAELSRQCCVSPQSTAALVQRLEAEGCLCRRPHPLHGRVIELRITAKGRRLLYRASAVVDRLERDLLLGWLSAEEQDHLRQVLRHVLDRSRSRALPSSL